MGYLQLAEDPFTSLADNVMMNKDKYVFIPAGYRGSEKDLYVREDFFDDMPDSVYQQMMQELAAYQNTGLSGKADRKARRQERKDAKAAKKATKGGGARREARQKRLETKWAGKEKKASAKGSGKGAAFLDKVGGIVGDIVGKGPVDIETDSLDFQYDQGGGEPSFFDKYKVPLIIGGVALIGGGIYLATRKKKR